MGFSTGSSGRAGAWHRVVGAALVALLLAAASGCGRSKEDPPDVKASLKALQRNRPKDVVDLLAKNDTPRGRWLKAIALERMNQLDDAGGQIERALEADPANPEFRGFQLRLRVYKADLDAVNELLTIREENRTSAALSLFAFYAHMARSVHLKVTKHEEDAITEGGRAMRALSSAVALGGDLPEFQREILSLAIKAKAVENADIISGKLLKALPDDMDVIEDRLAVLNLMREFDAAVPIAQHLYDLQKRSPEAALRFAAVLERTTPNPPHDQLFELLATDHPKHIVVLVKRAVYMARSQRFDEARKQLTKSIESRTDKESRRVLIDALISLALESGGADLCEQCLEDYRKEIADSLVVAYFQGRIRYLRKDYVGALRQLSLVIDGEKTSVGTRRALAREAVRWTRMILADQEAAKTLDTIAKGIRTLADPNAPASDDEPARAELPGESEPQQSVSVKEGSRPDGSGANTEASNGKANNTPARVDDSKNDASKPAPKQPSAAAKPEVRSANKSEADAPATPKK